MQQNTNILIIIAVITLACGQLYRLTQKEFFELNQLTKNFDKRYAKDIPEREITAWLDKSNDEQK